MDKIYSTASLPRDMSDLFKVVPCLVDKCVEREISVGAEILQAEISMGSE